MGLDPRPYLRTEKTGTGKKAALEASSLSLDMSRCHAARAATSSSIAPGLAAIWLQCCYGVVWLQCAALPSETYSLAAVEVQGFDVGIRLR